MNGLKKAMLRNAVTFTFVLLFLVVGTAWSKSGAKEHIAEWEQCIGIDVQSTTNRGNEDNLSPIWQEAQNWIDRCEETGTYNKIKDKFPWFCYDNHRLLFHWGFNAHVEEYTPLLERIDKMLSKEAGTTPKLRMKQLIEMVEGKGIDEKKHDEYAQMLKNYSDMLPQTYEKYLENHPGGSKADWKAEILKDLKRRTARLEQYKKEQKRKLLNYLQKLHDGYKRHFIRTVSEKTGLPLEGGAAEALASLIYDIHILLDYDDELISHLQKLKNLEKNIRKNGLRRLVTSDADSNLAEFNKMMNKAHNSFKLRAQDMRNALKKVLPQILQDQYDDVLKEKKIYIIPQNKTQLYKEAA